MGTTGCIFIAKFSLMEYGCLYPYMINHPLPRQQKTWRTLWLTYEDYKTGINIHEYAKDHEELAQAIEFFEKKENKEVRHAERRESN